MGHNTKIIIKSSVLSLIFLLGLISSSFAEEVGYNNLFGADLKKHHTALWKVYEDPKQNPSIIEDRRIRMVLVGRYENFEELFNEYAYKSLSVYKSPFQAKILLIDHFFNKFVDLEFVNSSERMYLTINNFKKNYFNLYPHVYKKTPQSKKKTIIPNKLFQVEFFLDDRYVEAYQQLFDAITDAVRIDRVKTISMMPQLLDLSSDIKLTESSKFNFYKIEATVNEIMVKEALDEFFINMSSLTDVIRVTEFYKTKYKPEKGSRYEQLEERIISVNVLYNPDTDFDYYDMEYAKAGSLLHEYFYFEGLIKERIPSLFRGGVKRIFEVQEVYNKSLYPDERLFYFENDLVKEEYYDHVIEFYDSIPDIMDVTEEILVSDELDLDVIKLTATLDEIALGELMQNLKEEIRQYVPKPGVKKQVQRNDDDQDSEEDDEDERY